jgi:hypothetical protein
MAAIPPLDSDICQKSQLEMAKEDLQALIQKLDGIYVRFLKLFVCCVAFYLHLYLRTLFFVWSGFHHSTCCSTQTCRPLSQMRPA